MANKTEELNVDLTIKQVSSDDVLKDMEENDQLGANQIIVTETDTEVPMMPVGSIFASAIPQTDARVHLLDGSTISQTGIYETFANLIKALDSAGNNITYKDDENSTANQKFDADVSATGNCGKFVIDDTNGTIRLPKITTFIQGLSSITNIGSSLSAGLPNITGQFDVVSAGNGAGYPFDYRNSTGAFTGAFKNPTTSSGKHYHSSSSSTTTNSVITKYNFNANDDNKTYGNSTTVQPNATQYPYYIVLASGYKSSQAVDIDNIMNDVNSKLPLAGGTLSGNLAFPRSKGIKTSGGANMLEWNNSTGYITLGGSSISTLIAGYSERPVYNATNNPLALYSDCKVTHGYKTFNSTYCTGVCNWWRIGQIMFVCFQDVVFTAQPPSDPNGGTNLLTSTLPKPLVDTLFMLTPHTTSSANARLAINAYAGKVLSWWANISLNVNYAGFISYVAKDGE